MQTSEARKSHLMRSIQKVLGTAQQILRTFLGEELQKPFWADSCPAGENSLKMIFAQPNVCCYLFQAWLLFKVIFKVQDRLLDAQVIFRALFEINLSVHRSLLIDYIL